MSLEPTDVGPAAGGDLRASDADRRRVLDLLTAARNEGRLSEEEHHQRTFEASVATTFDDLIPLTRDLVPALGSPKPELAPLAPVASSVVVDPAGAEGESESRTTIFGTSRRTGEWRVRKHTGGLVLFGDQIYDMTKATFDADTVELEVFAMFSDVKLLVPAGVRVVDQTGSLFADTGAKGLDESVPGPTIVIKGMAIFADIQVIGPRHKSWWKRLKRLTD